MPGRLKVRILSARDLPIMDRASELTDAFVEVRFGSDSFKTEVCKKSLNPQWNSDWFKFEVDDEVLQDESLDLRVLDYDTYSAHDAIGKVYIDLNPLLTSRETPHVISGWFPIYDTMHGIRGELNIQVRVDLFSDFNKFRQSSCGIQLFCTSAVPIGYRVQSMLGFIEELVVNDDPEYQWIEKIRTPRASNEARQKMFSKLSGELQRKLGVKVLEMGGNAVLGYHQNFDLEGESGIVVRAVGTAVALSKSQLGQMSPAVHASTSVSPAKDMRRHTVSLHHRGTLHHYYHHHPHHHPHHHHSLSQSPVSPTHVSAPHPIVRQHSVGVPVSLSTSSSPQSPWSFTRRLSLSTPHSPPPSAPVIVHRQRTNSESKAHRGVKALIDSPASSSSPHTSVFHFPSSNTPFSDDNVAAPTSAQQPAPLPSQSASAGTPANPTEPQNPPIGEAATTIDSGPSAPSTTVATDSITTSTSMSNLTNTTTGMASASATPTAQTVAAAATKLQTQQSTLSHHRHSTSPVQVTGTSDSSRRMSDSEMHSPTSSLSGSTSALPIRSAYTKTAVLQQSIEMLEFPFFTIRSFPSEFIVSLGGVVSARSVKLLDKIHNPEEAETRDAWWSELRTEIKAHATKLGCHAVLGYYEQTSICDEVIILSAMGTAAKINLNLDLSRSSVVVPSGYPPVNAPSHQSGSSDASTTPGSGDKSSDSKDKHLFVDITLANQAQQRTLSIMENPNNAEEAAARCSMCHIPYSPTSLPFEIQLSKCAICKRKNVPEVLFTTIDPPTDIPVWSKGCLLQARICRPKSKNKSSEQSAREVSDSLPFVEYEVHSQLINKLKIRGLNCLFGLSIQISLGDNMLVAVATATGVYVGPLPAPPQPKLSTEVATAAESQDLITLQNRINRTVQLHRDRLTSEIVDRQPEHSPHSAAHSDEESDGDVDDPDFYLEQTKDKNTFVLVIDDLKDDAVALILHDLIPPDGFDICNTQRPPGIPSDRVNGNMQMFTQMVRIRFQPTLNTSLEFSNVFNTLIRRICYKLRHLRPCYLTDINFMVDIPDEDEVNIILTGCCLSIQDPSSQPGSASNSAIKLQVQARVSEPLKPSSAPVNQTDDMMFPLDGVGSEQTTSGAISQAQTPQSTTQHPAFMRAGSVPVQINRSLKRLKEPTLKNIAPPPVGIELTPLNIVYNGKIEKYLGYYNFFFIRESTSVRECGGIGGFMHSFVLEVMAIVRANVSALGGNALVAFNMSQCVLDNNPHKNQGQCLINVSGDVVYVAYDSDADNVFQETQLPIPAPLS